LAAGFYRKYFVLRNLEAKFMKTENLLDLFAAQEQGETPRVWTQYTTHRDRIAD
jgi:hypothetical protein